MSRGKSRPLALIAWAVLLQACGAAAEEPVDPLRPREGEQLLWSRQLTGRETKKEYQVYLFYRERTDCYRVEMFRGAQHLDALHNRFGGSDPKLSGAAVYTRQDGKEVLSLSTRRWEVTIDLEAVGPSTAPMYDGLERVIPSLKQPGLDPAKCYPELHGPPGLLKRTYEGFICFKPPFMGGGDPSVGRYLVTPDGTATKLTSESLLVAYNREGIQADTEGERDRICRSLIPVLDARFKAAVINGLADIPGYQKHPLDPDLEATVRAPWTYKDPRGYVYWIGYTYCRTPGMVRRYKFKFDESGKKLTNPVEEFMLGRDIGDYRYGG